MNRLKPYVLPAAIVLGLLFHSVAATATWTVPWAVFAILLLNFSAVDLLRLPINRLDLMVMLFQTAASVAFYIGAKVLGANEAIAQGALICIICPVASSVVVVASELGADRRITTGYTIYGNMLVAVVAPVLFSFVGVHQDMPFADSAWLIFKKIAPVIGLPYFVALLLQLVAPRLKEGISRFKGWAFPLWAAVLLITLGTTIDYLFLYHRGNGETIAWIVVVTAAICALQFAVGRVVGRRLGHTVAGAQLFGQKNTGIGIWMASIYLTPLAGGALAFYSIFQNIFNSWQMWHRRKTAGQQPGASLSTR